jgi:hypothetical protein
MGCCLSKEPDPVTRLSMAPALTQKTLTFSKPMPHTQGRSSAPARRDQQQRLVQKTEAGHDSDGSEHEDGEAALGHEDLDTGDYAAPDVADGGAGDGPRGGRAGGGGGGASRGPRPEVVFESGWLTKEPLHIKGKAKELSFQRQERFFHLKGTVLLYYKEECDRKGLCEDGSKASLKGGLRLIGGLSTVKLQGRRITVTGMTTSEQEASLYMFVRSAQDGEKWRDALQRAINTLQPPPAANAAALEAAAADAGPGEEK